jgi:hypothetical protein
MHKKKENKIQKFATLLNFQILTTPLQMFEAVSRSKCNPKDYSIKEHPNFHPKPTTQPRSF